MADFTVTSAFDVLFQLGNTKVDEQAKKQLAEDISTWLGSLGVPEAVLSQGVKLKFHEDKSTDNSLKEVAASLRSKLKTLEKEIRVSAEGLERESKVAQLNITEALYRAFTVASSYKPRNTDQLNKDLLLLHNNMNKGTEIITQMGREAGGKQRINELIKYQQYLEAVNRIKEGIVKTAENGKSYFIAPDNEGEGAALVASRRVLLNNLSVSIAQDKELINVIKTSTSLKNQQAAALRENKAAEAAIAKERQKRADRELLRQYLPTIDVAGPDTPFDQIIRSLTARKKETQVALDKDAARSGKYSGRLINFMGYIDAQIRATRTQRDAVRGNSLAKGYEGFRDTSKTQIDLATQLIGGRSYRDLSDLERKDLSYHTQRALSSYRGALGQANTSQKEELLGLFPSIQDLRQFGISGRGKDKLGGAYSPLSSTYTTYQNNRARLNQTFEEVLKSGRVIPPEELDSIQKSIKRQINNTTSQLDRLHPSTARSQELTSYRAKLEQINQGIIEAKKAQKKAADDEAAEAKAAAAKAAMNAKVNTTTISRGYQNYLAAQGFIQTGLGKEGRTSAETAELKKDIASQIARIKQLNLNYAHEAELVAKLTASKEYLQGELKRLNQATADETKASENKAKAEKEAADRISADAKAARLAHGADLYTQHQGNFDHLPPAQLRPIAEYLHEQTRNNGGISREINARYTELNAAAARNEAEAVAHLRGEITQLNATHHTQSTELSRINGILTDHVGFLHQAGLAARQFLRYAILYGSGFAALQGIKNLFTGSAQLDKQLHQIKAIANASEETMAAVEATIKDVGSSSQFAIGEIAEAAQVLAQAGIELDKLPSVLSSVSKLASTTGADLKSATDIVTSLMEVFQGQGVTNIADQVAQAVNISKLDMEGLKTIMSLSASTAQMSGVQLNQLLGASATLANRGIKSSTIATGLRETLLELFSPDEKMVSYLRQRYTAVGEVMNEAMVKARFNSFKHSKDPILSALTELNRIGVAGEGRSAFNRVTDIRAQNVLMPLIESIGQLSENASKITQSGAIAKGAATNMEAFSNALTSAGSSVVALSHELVSGLLPALTTVVKGAQELIDGLRHRAAEASGNSSVSGWRSWGAGAVAAGVAGLKTTGGIFKRGVAAITTGLGVQQADNALQSSELGNKVSAVAETAGYLYLLRTLTPKILEGVAAGKTAVEGVKGFLNILVKFFAVAPWGRIISAAVAIGGLAVEGYNVLSNSRDSRAKSKSANESLASARAKQDEVSAQFDAYDVNAKDSQAQGIRQLQDDFNKAKASVEGVLGKEVSKDMMQAVLALGSEGLEVNSKAYKEAVAKLSEKGKLNPEQLKVLTEAGVILAQTMSAVAGKISQTAETIQTARQSKNLDEGTTALLNAFDHLSQKQKDAATAITSSKDVNELPGRISALLDLMKGAFGGKEAATKGLEANSIEARGTAARSLISSGMIDDAGLQSALSSLTVYANAGNVDTLTDLQGALAGVMATSDQEASRKGQLRNAIADSIKAAKDNQKSQKEAEAKKIADDERQKRLAEEDVFIKSREASLVSAAEENYNAGKAHDFASKGDPLLTNELEARKKAAESRNNLAEAQGYTENLAERKKTKTTSQVLVDVAKFEQELFSGPLRDSELAKGLLSARESGVDALERAKYYVTNKSAGGYSEDFAALHNKDLSTLQDTLRESVVAASEVLSDLSLAKTQYSQQSSEKSVAERLEVLNAEREANRREIDGARSKGELDKKAVELGDKQLANARDIYKVEAERMKLAGKSPEAIELFSKNREKEATQEYENLVNEGTKRKLKSESAGVSRELKAIDKYRERLIAVGNSEELAKTDAIRASKAKELLELEIAIAEKDHVILDEKEKQEQLELGLSNIRGKELDDQIEAIAKNKAARDRHMQAISTRSPFDPETEGYLGGIGTGLTKQQQALVAAKNLADMQSNLENIRQDQVAAQSAYLKAINNKDDTAGVLKAADELEALNKEADDASKTIGKYKAELVQLNGNLFQVLDNVSTDGVLEKFQKLNGGFSSLKNDIENNIAQTLDGVTGIFSDFIITGGQTVQQIQELHSAMMQTSQAQQNYYQTVSNRIGLMSELASSPSFMKESAAVQALIIQQSTAAQAAAESAAKQQALLAQYEEKQVARNQSLTGRLQNYAVSQAQQLGGSILKDVFGEGVSKVLGIGTPAEGNKPGFLADGTQKVYVTNAGDISGTAGKGQSKLVEAIKKGLGIGKGNSGGLLGAFTGLFGGSSGSSNPLDIQNIGFESLKGSGGSGSKSAIGKFFSDLTGGSTGGEIASSLGSLGNMLSGKTGEIVFKGFSNASEYLSSLFSSGTGSAAAEQGISNAISNMLPESYGATTGSVATDVSGFSKGASGALTESSLGLESSAAAAADSSKVPTVASVTEEGASKAAGTGVSAAAEAVGPILSIIGSIASIYSTISQHDRNESIRKAIFDEAATPKSFFTAADVNKIANTPGTSPTDTNYRGLSGYLPESQYITPASVASSFQAAGSVMRVANQPMQFSGASAKTINSPVTTGVDKANSAAAGQKPTEQAAPSVRIVNVVDQSLVHDFMSSASGEKIILNTMQRNAMTVKELIR